MIAEQCGRSINRMLIKGMPVDLLKSMYTSMVKIRLVENKVADLVSKKEIICPCHLYIGQEAVATGVCSSLRSEDYVFSTHRSHGHYIAKGGDIRSMMAELYGRVTGCSRGKGGSMHLTAPDVGFLGSSAIVAGTIPLAVGAALSFSIQGNDKVSVAFFGDGATCEGAFYESLNFAALKKLPVIFICENNFYSTHMHISAIQADINLYKRAEGFNIPAIQIDGNNVVEVFQAAREAIENARAGNGPALIECFTYRWRGHVGPNWDIDKGLRSQEEVDWWIGNCAIKRFEELLLDEGILNPKEKQHIYNKIETEVDDAVTFAKNSPFPDPDDSMESVFKK